MLTKYGADVVAGKVAASPIVRKQPTETDLMFRRDLALEAVFAWQDATLPVVRDAIERILFNVGVSKVGECGERLAFNGAIHRTADDVIPGEMIEIESPGWELQTRRGIFMLSSAMVRKV